MKSEDEIRERIEEIENDHVYQLDEADVNINAPRALRQTSMKAKKSILEWVLED